MPATAPKLGAPATATMPKPLTPPAPSVPSLNGNRDFNIFWAGRSLSVIGDAFALIALPLLVLQATGSVLQMGLVTGLYGVGQFIAGLGAGQIVDRLDRRRLMIACDLIRFVLLGLIPLGWALAGPQIWLVYVVVALGAMVDMVFQVAYVTAIPNLVQHDQITAANARIDVTESIAFTVGPVLAGIASARFGAANAIGVDALSFLVSTASLVLIRFHNAAPAAPKPAHEPGGALDELLAGLRFVWRHPVLRSMALLVMGSALILAEAFDLVIFHLKADLAQTDDTVGVIFGVGAIGAIAGGLVVARLRQRFGFGVCWLGGAAVTSLVFLGIGLSPAIFLIAFLVMVYTFASTLRGIAQVSLRQEITPDHLLGRVTAAFWLFGIGPGAIGAALGAALAAQFGAPVMLVVMGIGGLAVAGLGLLTPVRLPHPEALDVSSGEATASSSG